MKLSIEPVQEDRGKKSERMTEIRDQTDRQTDRQDKQLYLDLPARFLNRKEAENLSHKAPVRKHRLDAHW